MKSKFTWVQTHKELTQYLSKMEGTREDLIELLKEAGCTKFNDKDESGSTIDLKEIDPFTFFAYINKYGDERRLNILQNIAEKLNLSKPEDHYGLPSIHAQNVWFFPYKFERNNDEIDRLWSFFYDALDQAVTNEKFSDVLKIRSTAEASLTAALFYIDPENYFPINGPTKPYLKEVLGINPKFSTWQEYLEILSKVKENTDKSFYKTSYEAWAWNEEQKKTNYWVFQCNPSKFDVISVLEEGNLSDWTVDAHKDKIKKGDKVILWVTGKQAGCYALCETTSDVYEDTVEVSHKGGGEQLTNRVDMKITHNLVERPVMKAEVEQDDRLSDLKAGHQGTNFTATQEEYETFVEMAEQTTDETKKSQLPEMNYSLNTIFYGPPGTGKTYTTIKRAAEIVAGRKIEKYEDAKKIFHNHLHEEIEFITFHQNYSYEDFIQGLRPDIENDKELTFNREDGLFKRLADRALKNLEASKRPQIKKKSFQDVFNEFVKPLVEGEVEELEVEMKRVSYFITAVTNRSIEFRKASGDSAHSLSINTLRRMYEAEDILEIQGLSSYYSPLLNKLLDLGKSPGEREIIQRKNYVIIIDEINRANISRVFGELITLIEPDKRSEGEFALSTKLPSGETFTVPSNLHIIGTMNTADKSIALLDIALRRRFEFEAMYPRYEIDGETVHDKDVLKKINERIIKLKGHDFQIGHSYFMKNHMSLKQRMNHKVIPLLLEYFMNDEQEVRGILEHAGLVIEEASWPLRINGKK